MTALHPAALSSQAPGTTAMTTSAAAGSASSVPAMGDGGVAQAGQGPELARRFLQYSDRSPTPFHAVATSARMLEQAGFRKLREADVWDGAVERGGKY